MIACDTANATPLRLVAARIESSTLRLGERRASSGDKLEGSGACGMAIDVMVDMTQLHQLHQYWSSGW